MEEADECEHPGGAAMRSKCLVLKAVSGCCSDCGAFCDRLHVDDANRLRCERCCPFCTRRRGAVGAGRGPRVVGHGDDTMHATERTKQVRQDCLKQDETKQERLRMSERVKAGQERARRQGATLGRPRRVFDRRKTLDLQAEGHSLREIARRTGLGDGTVRRALDDLASAQQVRQNPSAGTP